MAIFLYILFLIFFHVISLFNMQDSKEIDLLERFKKISHNAEKLEKFKTHVSKLGGNGELEKKIDDRLYYLEAKKILKKIRYTHGLANFKKLKETLITLVTANDSLTSHEKKEIEKVLIPQIISLENTNKLFSSKQAEDMYEFLPRSQEELSRQFQSFDSSEQNDQGESILHLALRHHLPEYTIGYLLSCGHSPQETNKKQQNAIHIAVEENNTQGLLALLEYFPEINITRQKVSLQKIIDAQDHSGQTPLHKASILQYLECAQILRKYNACISIPDNAGKKPADYLRMHNASNMPKISRTKITSPKKDKKIKKDKTTIEPEPTVPLSPLEKKSIEILSHIIQGTLNASFLYAARDAINIPDIITQKTPLCFAIEQVNFNATKLLLENGADPNIPSILLILEKGKSATPLEFVTCIKGKNKKKKFLELLLSKNADPNRGGIDPILHTFCLSGQHDYIDVLIKYGADVNLLDSSGESPLHLACVEQSYLCIKKLLEHGANPNLKNKKGDSALDYCYKHKNSQTIILLLKNYATEFRKKIFLNGKEHTIYEDPSQTIKNFLNNPYIETELAIDKYGIHLTFSYNE